MTHRGEGAKRVTFGIPGNVIFDMDLGGGPVPPGVPNQLDAIFAITCTESQAEAMESWLLVHGAESEEYRTAAEDIRRTLHEANQLDYRGWRIELLSSQAPDAEGWRAHVTVLRNEAGGIRTKRLSYTDARLFPTEGAADAGGMALAVAWIDEQG